MRLFRLFGIDVFAGWIAIPLVLILTMSMSGTVQRLMNVGFGMSHLLGFGLALLFILSIIAHEYGHSLVAKAYGMTVRKIHLHPFGGVAMLESPFPGPRAELWVAIAGPLVSFAIAAGSIGLARFTPEIIGKSLIILGVANGVIGLFNLIPAFPLDGGRVLRASIWLLTGKFTVATKIASFFGLLFGLWIVVSGVLMMAGLTVPMWGDGRVSGAWNVLFGAFICFLARVEAKRLPPSIPVSDPEGRLKNQQIE